MEPPRAPFFDDDPDYAVRRILFYSEVKRKYLFMPLNAIAVFYFLNAFLWCYLAPSETDKCENFYCHSLATQMMDKGCRTVDSIYDALSVFNIIYFFAAAVTLRRDLNYLSILINMALCTVQPLKITFVFLSLNLVHHQALIMAYTEPELNADEEEQLADYVREQNLNQNNRDHLD